MPHSFVKIRIQAVRATKERYPLIQSKIEISLFGQMRNEFKESGCFLRIVNGMPDHVHCLFLLNREKSIAEIIKQVKGSTSHWVNEQDIISEKFAWQTGYAAFSVSESQLEKVFKYIKNQKTHHVKTTFQGEYDEFIKLHGLQNDIAHGLNHEL